MAHTERSDRTVDLESLKALAHPLRVRIVDTLSTYGAATATGLADRLGESSGATSYHLRQLAKHGFVREVEGRGTGRERWWERPPGGLTLTTPELMESPAGKAASRLIVREWSTNRERILQDFIDRGPEVLSREWQEASMMHLTNLVLTVEQLDELNKQLQSFLADFSDRYRDQQVEGARPVHIHINGFPVIDAEAPNTEKRR